MTRAQRALIIAAVLVIAGLLAFPLREAIYETIVIPAAFILWNLELFYHSFSQGIWWWVLVILVLYMLVFSLAPQPRSRHKKKEQPRPPQGQVESFATWLRKGEQGVYFKWLVANRLGKLAYQILLHRESGRPRSVFAPLLGPGWEPKKELQQYLETGLHGSFADFPHRGSRFSPPERTPLDLSVEEAVDFIESQIQDGRSSPKR